MNLKNFLSEEDKKLKFNVGDRIKVKPDGADGNEETANKTGVVIAINYNEEGTQYEVGVKLDNFDLGHDLSIGILGGEDKYKRKDLKNSGWWGYPSDFIKIKISKHVKQLQFEAFEPGQYIEKDKYVVNVQNETESRKLQRWAVKNKFSWGYNNKEYAPNPILTYKEKAGIHLNFISKRLDYSDINWFIKSGEQNGYGDGTILSLDDFLDIMEDDDRIKYKPSQLKEK